MTARPINQPSITAALSDKEVTPFEVDGKTKALPKNGEAGKGNSFDNVKAKGGNSAEYTASRLARDNPELHKEVRDGDLTLNQAAIRAGVWIVPTNCK